MRIIKWGSGISIYIMILGKEIGDENRKNMRLLGCEGNRGGFW